MKLKFTLLILLFSGSIFAQQKTFLDFRNEATAIYPGCENAENKEECYKLKVGDLVLEEVKKQDKSAPLKPDEISVKITIYNNATGESTYKIVTDNKQIEQLTEAALKKLPAITPTINFTTGEPASSSYGFYVILHRNKKTKTYEQLNKSTTEQYRKKPHPFPMKIDNAHFKSCPKEDTFVTPCFQEQFTKWITAQMGDEMNNLKGTMAKIRIVVNEEGNVSILKLETESGKLKAALEKAFINFPKMEPATVNGQISGMVYDIMPIRF